MMGNSTIRRRAGAPRLLLVAVALVAVAGCTRGVTSTYGDAPNLEGWVADVKTRPAPPLDPLPIMQQFETFEYAAHGLRDPFSNAFTDRDNGGGPTRTGARCRWSSSRWIRWTWSERWAAAVQPSPW